MFDETVTGADAVDVPPGTKCLKGAEPGSYRLEDLPAQHYHSELTRHSCSTLKQMLVSPGHYMQQFTAHKPTSPAMEFGSLVHLLILEPNQLPYRYAVIPGSGRRPSAGERREAQAFYPGLHILTEAELHEARIAAEKAMERQVRGRPFQRFVEEGLREVTFFYRDPVAELPCRVRMDLWHPDAIFDLKTTRHALLGDFSRACLALHYDLQAYMYCLADARFDGRDCARDFVFLAVQGEPPHPVHVLAAGSSFMANGEAKYVRALSLLRACSETDYWPDNSAEGTLEILPWQAFEAVDVAAGANCSQKA
jgi:hypothetical protein